MACVPKPSERTEIAQSSGGSATVLICWPLDRIVTCPLLT
jgi:hypothetical protein